MKSIITLGAFALFSTVLSAQDTFSIVAVDTVTGEVGSAGASCVDLDPTGLPTDDFLGVLVPGVGAINTQASYNTSNQSNATHRMNQGDTPTEIIQWLEQNDIQGNKEIRQYGIAAIIDGSAQAAAFTGANTLDYKNHIVGANYSIQGNILSGQDILDSMEARFNREEGDLACKLMAALQGANVVGADSRCASNGTSSLFAFVKVARPNDPVGEPSILESVRTADNAGIEPIDSLQIKFDLSHSCNLGLKEFDNEDVIRLFPNPSSDFVSVRLKDEMGLVDYQVMDLQGHVLVEGHFEGSTKIDLGDFSRGVYVLKMELDGKMMERKLVRE